MLKYIYVFALICAWNNCFSQKIEEIKTSILEKSKEIPLPQKKFEVNLSLEEQGFVLVSSNGIKIYRKEMNGILIEYTTEKQ